MGKIEKIETVKVSKLIPYEKNAKMHGKNQLDVLKKSIQEFGFLTPCLIDKDFNIIAGHGRVMAAKQLKIESVPCVFVEGLTESQRRAYILADNRLGELGEWDMDLVMEELTDLNDLNFDISLTGFELDLDLGGGSVGEDDFSMNVASRVSPGDLWQLGSHRLICGNSTSTNVIEKLMGENKADLVFTDPPYRVVTRGGCKGDVGKALEKQGNDIDFISNFEPEEFLNMLPGMFDNRMNAYVFCNKDLLPDYLNWARANKYSFNVLIWKKPNAIPLGGSHRPDIEYLLLFRKKAIWNNNADANYSRCLEYNRPIKDEENGNHPTIKPVELIANELKISSNEGSIVVDLFGGSGSTLIACEQLKRICYMCELDAHYCDVIIERWEKLTEQKAVRIVE